MLQRVYHEHFLVVYAMKKSSRPEMFCKKGFLRKFTKFIGKHLCQSLFFKDTINPLQLFTEKRQFFNQTKQ